MRAGIATAVTVALIGFASALITVVFEKESDNSLTKFVYQDENISQEKCVRDEEYPKIIFTDKE